MSEPVQPTLSDRLLTAIRAIIRSEMPTVTYCGTYEYQANGVNSDGSINCTPIDPTVPLPGINNVPLRTSTTGGTSKPTVGNKVLIRFVNCDPTRPICVGCDALVNTVTIDATQTVTIGPSVGQAVMIGPGASQPAARMNDTGVVYFPTAPMVVSVGAVLATAPGIVTGSIIITMPGTFIIQTGTPFVLQ
jgi:hypothetical protein